MTAGTEQESKESPERAAKAAEGLVLNNEIREDLAVEFDRLARDLNPVTNDGSNLNRAQAAQVLQQIHKEVEASGEVPNYSGQKEIIGRVLEAETVTGLGEWKIAVKYAALLAMHLIRSRYIRTDRD